MAGSLRRPRHSLKYPSWKIRKIRSSLTSEIGQLKDAVKERRSKEQQQQAQLMASIETLQKKQKELQDEEHAQRKAYESFLANLSVE